MTALFSCVPTPHPDRRTLPSTDSLKRVQADRDDHHLVPVDGQDQVHPHPSRRLLHALHVRHLAHLPIHARHFLARGARMKPAAVAGGWWGHEMCACANASVERLYYQIAISHSTNSSALIGAPSASSACSGSDFGGGTFFFFFFFCSQQPCQRGGVPSNRASKSAPTGSWQDQLRMNINN